MFKDAGNQSGPTGLMVGSQSSTVITVKVLVKLQVIPPLRIGLKLLCAPVDRPPAVLILQEGPSQPIGDLFAHLEEIHQLP